LSRHHAEDGFTLVEVLIAIVVITTGLLVVAATTYTAFRSIGFSRQRDTATGLANQAMEQIKALSFTNLVMSLSDIQTDSLVTCSGTPTTCTFKGRTIPTVTGTNPSAPLYPHTTASTPSISSTTPGQTTYTVSSYVTFDVSGNTQDRIATVRVSWNHATVNTNAFVQLESTIFANGPLATGTGHVWTAQATDSPGTISLGLTTFISGNVASLSFGPGSTTASIAANGTASATSNVADSSLDLLNLPPVLSTSASNATASSSPGQAVSGPTSNTVFDTGPLSPISSILGLDTGSLGITGGVGITNNTAAVAASSSNGSASLVSGVSMPSSALPYAQGTVKQTGPISLGLNLSVLNILGIQVLNQNVTLLNITPLGNSNPDIATVCQQSSSASGCSAAMPDSVYPSGVAQTLPNGAAITAEAQKNYSEISVLPNSGNSCNSLLDIQGFKTSASASAGPGLSNTGLTSQSAAKVCALGSSFSLTNLVNVLKSTTVSVGLLGTLNVTAQFSTGSATTSGNSALVTSPLTLTVGVSLAGLINLSLVVNLGQVSATASYS
jgi:prepilin-type N-terminal cleavage/methylation domain-containing protein